MIKEVKLDETLKINGNTEYEFILRRIHKSFTGCKRLSSSDLIMEGVGGDGPWTTAAALNRWGHQVSKIFLYYLDKSTPHVRYRWIGTSLLVFVHALRVYYIQGFYFVTYCLGFYIMDLVVKFLSPLTDPELEPSDRPLLPTSSSDDPELEPSDCPMLPTSSSDEFKPFIRLPEFKFWYAVTNGFCVAFVLTFFPLLDFPVYWPVLPVLWLLGCALNLKGPITRMIKYKYNPFKQTCKGKKPASSASCPRAGSPSTITVQ